MRFKHLTRPRGTATFTRCTAVFAGLLRGYLGQEAGIVQVVDFVAMALFAHIWIGGLIETEWGSPEVTP